RPRTSPEPMDKVTLSSARRPPKVTVTPRTSRSTMSPPICAPLTRPTGFGSGCTISRNGRRRYRLSEGVAATMVCGRVDRVGGEPYSALHSPATRRQVRMSRGCEQYSRLVAIHPLPERRADRLGRLARGLLGTGRGRGGYNVS